MKWLRISSALTGIAACSLVLAQVAPHAREAGAILAAQDDPAALSELKLDAALAQTTAWFRTISRPRLALAMPISPTVLSRSRVTATSRCPTTC